MTRFEGLTDEWVLQQIREGAITTNDLYKAYLRFILKTDGVMVSYLETNFKQQCYAKLRRLERQGLVERCGKAQLLYTNYMTWRAVQ